MTPDNRSLPKPDRQRQPARHPYRDRRRNPLTRNQRRVLRGEAWPSLDSDAPQHKNDQLSPPSDIKTATTAAYPIGLDPIETSSTRLDSEQQIVIEIDLHAARNQTKKRQTVTSARLLQEAAAASPFRHYWIMVTLTYRTADQWRAGQITQFLERLAKHLERRGHPLRAVHCLEMQKRGVAHYHVAILLPVGITIPKPDKAGWWTHGITNTCRAKNAPAYLAKYIGKPEQTALMNRIPKGARIAGARGLTPAMRCERRWWRLPLAIRKATTPNDDVRKTKGGYLARATGEFWPSLWGYSCTYRINGRPYVRLRLKHLPPTQAATLP